MKNPGVRHLQLIMMAYFSAKYCVIDAKVGKPDRVTNRNVRKTILL